MEIIAKRWSELAERRRIHFVELYDSGRWKHYYTEDEFVAVLRDVVKAAEAWGRLAHPQQNIPQNQAANGVLSPVYEPIERRKAS